VSLAFQPHDRIYVYASYAEGFTAGALESSPVLPDPIVLDPEVVRTKEIGLRSDWLDRRLVFNATLFRSRWDGLRVSKQIEDPSNPGQVLPQTVPTSDGNAAARGLEVDIAYRASDRWSANVSLGLLDTEYLDIGVPPANGTGLQPGIPFAYAPRRSFSLGAQYRWPLARRGELRFAGSYGWMDEYERASAAQFQTRNSDGSHRPEPAYGLLNGRIAFAPADKNWTVSVYGTNLTNERYVSGGLDTGSSWGFDIVTLGRPRELGVGMTLELD
jgi:iron complex outermembrane receptor protein